MTLLTSLRTTFKEPLRGINNYATFLVEDYGDKLGEDGRQRLETLQKLSHRMELLIDSLLTYSRVGRVDLACKETDLQAVVEDVLFTLQHGLDEAGVRVHIDRPLPTIHCDGARIAEVFRNLISNAMKYNDKSDKRIEIGYIGPDDPGAKKDVGYVFFVRDNGIGIPEKHLDKLFKMFKRLHGRDKFGGGTGVGLTIVKKIVEKHQGRVWAESEHGQGTTF